MVGKTLVQEERIEAREAELESTIAKAEFGMQDGREKTSARQSGGSRADETWGVREATASVDRFVDPDRVDPRVEIGREKLAEVNQATERIDEELDGWSRGAISRRIAENVVRVKDVPSAVLNAFDELQTADGTVIHCDEHMSSTQSK